MVTSISGRKVKQPYFIRAADELIGFAGLWSEWSKPEGELLLTCTILTREAAPGITHIHNRMPVVLPADCFDAWLDPGTGADDVQDLIAEARDDVSAHQVSTTVGNTRKRGTDLIEEAPT